MFSPDLISPHALPHRREQGIVLIIALIMLVVVSMLAAMSMRNSSSTESISGAVRSTNLATQAAEIALRYCEESTKAVISGTSSFPATSPTTFTAANVLPPGSPPAWQNLATWDSASTAAFVLPTASVNQAGLTATFSRPPECMVEPLPTLVSGAVSNTTSFVITARGFGPEVPVADASRSRPVGAEVWLQSTIELASSGGGGSGGGAGGGSSDPGGDHDSNP